MFLDLTARMVDGVLVIDLAGELSMLASPSSSSLQDLLEQGRSDLVLNLSGISYIDSSGLGQLVTIWTSIGNRGGQLVLLRPSPQVSAQLQKTKLDTVFTIVQDEVEAVRRILKVVSARMGAHT